MITLHTLTLQMKKGKIDRGIGTVPFKCFEKCKGGFFSFQEHIYLKPIHEFPLKLQIYKDALRERPCQ